MYGSSLWDIEIYVIGCFSYYCCVTNCFSKKKRTTIFYAHGSKGQSIVEHLIFAPDVVAPQLGRFK